MEEEYIQQLTLISRGGDCWRLRGSRHRLCVEWLSSFRTPLSAEESCFRRRCPSDTLWLLRVRVREDESASASSRRAVWTLLLPRHVHGARCVRTRLSVHLSLIFSPADSRLPKQADRRHSQPREVVVVISESRSLRKTVFQRGLNAGRL